MLLSSKEARSGGESQAGSTRRSVCDLALSRACGWQFDPERDGVPEEKCASLCLVQTVI